MNKPLNDSEGNSMLWGMFCVVVGIFLIGIYDARLAFGIALVMFGRSLFKDGQKQHAARCAAEADAPLLTPRPEPGKDARQ